MSVIGVGEVAGHAPTRSSSSLLPNDSAIGRSPAGACARTCSTDTPESRRPSASIAPTGPPPAMMTSALAMPDEGFDVGARLGRRGGEHLASGRRHEHVVLDAYAD